MEKWLPIVIVAISSVLALYFIIVKNFHVAILLLTLMFTFSNFFRYRSFMRQGYVKEAQWMKWLSLFFAGATIVVIFTLIK